MGLTIVSLYYLTVAGIALLIYGGYRFVKAAKAHQAAPDLALNNYTFGVRDEKPELRAPFDQSKAEAVYAKAERVAQRRRARSRKVINAIPAQPVNVTPMRRAK